MQNTIEENKAALPAESDSSNSKKQDYIPTKYSCDGYFDKVTGEYKIINEKVEPSQSHR